MSGVLSVLWTFQPYGKHHNVKYKVEFLEIPQHATLDIFQESQLENWVFNINGNVNKTIVFFSRLCVVAIWTPPFIGDRLKHSEPHSCIWEPSNNTEFVIFVAVIGHYIPCIVMVFCYIKVFMVMRRQSSIVAGIGGESAASTIRIHVQPVSSHNQGISSHTSHVYIGDSHNADNIHAMESSNGRYLTTSSKVGSENSPPIRPPRQAEDYVARTTQTRSSNRTNRTSHNQQREKRIFITLTYILLSYLICWFPFYIAFDTYAWKPDLLPAGLYSFFFWSTYVNSTLNPFIYAFTNKEFRLAFIKVLKKIYRCPKQRVAA